MTPLQAARALADDLLRPAAEPVDRTRVPRSHLDALGRAGLLALPGPPELGGVPKEVAREVVEELAGACAATWFVSTQHATPVAALTASPNAPLRERLLAPLCRGEVLSGIAIAHLRRTDPPVVATRVEGGWRFDGHVGWMTSWGICDVVLLCGTTPDRSQVVMALVPAAVAPGLTASEPLRLLAMTATSTVTLELDGFVVADADVVDVQDRAAWAATDRDRTADVSPAVLGLQRELVRRTRERDPRVADVLGAAGGRVRARAYALAGDPDRRDERLAVRAEALELLARSATALVTVTGGSAMAAGSPAERHLREAAFLQVQGQTSDVRAAMAARLLG
ncbi:MAG: acyl-CoA dehydrogenase family protein [Nocardioides sp.]